MSGHATDISYPPVAVCRLSDILIPGQFAKLPEPVQQELLKTGRYEQRDVVSYLIDSKITRHSFRDDEGKFIWRLEFGHSRPLEIEAGQSVAFELTLQLPEPTAEEVAEWNRRAEHAIAHPETCIPSAKVFADLRERFSAKEP